MKIYITRHGETEWNKAGIMQGWKNSNLSEKGNENAKKLSQHLASVKFDAIYSSPLGRAMETATHLKGERNIEIIQLEHLKEMGFGVWEGMPHLEVQETYKEQQHNFWNQPHLYQPIDGETYEALIERVKKGLEKIVADKAGENVLVVAHGGVIKAIYTIIKNIPLEDFWKPPFITDTSLSIIQVKDEGIEFILEADVSHLG
ncbi:histidine phosphatase family protein [Alkaliphilus hydrothermalis]|uniref:Phosphoglycerate mutase n=1 Tax=Alkaliphilus hydrothermalis TaxID=1482730 RepID=A0ABS2NLK9_9FIRM|nr:histidine phosphatase family protein [Alkaliphilus hydrothermalis]MBM7613818.1 putative phosphoglycerate mutase [Alkaliphilus hydrothermalis]